MEPSIFPKVIYINAHFDNEIFNYHVFAYYENKFKLYCKRDFTLRCVIKIYFCIIGK